MRCPTCRKGISGPGYRYHPFCSERCKLSDLGGWLDERFRIAGEALKREPAEEDEESEE